MIISTMKAIADADIVSRKMPGTANESARLSLAMILVGL